MDISSMYKGWNKFEFSSSSIANKVAGASLALMCLVTVADIFARLVSKPIIGVWEVVALLLVPVVFLSFSYAYMTNSHIKVTVLTQKLPPRIRTGLEGLVQIAGGLVIALISWRLFIWAYDSWLWMEPNWGSIDIPMFPFKYGAAIGCVPFAFLFIEDGIRHLIKTVRWKGD
ncbi:TRAP transporter small permease [Chloroflexota bacterium]